MSRESIFVLDDESLEAKVLQYELKDNYDITTLTIPKWQDLETWKSDFEYHLRDVIEKMSGIIRIFLPYSFEDYQTKDIRTAFMEIQRKYPNVRVIPWFEQASKSSLERRALNYGITADIKLTGKPEAIAIDIPDDKPYKSSHERLLEFKKELDEPEQEDISNIASDIIQESKKVVSDDLKRNLSEASKPKGKKKREFNK